MHLESSYFYFLTLKFVNLSICLFICLFTCLFIYLFIYSFIHLFIYSFIYLFIYLFIYDDLYPLLLSLPPSLSLILSLILLSRTSFYTLLQLFISPLPLHSILFSRFNLLHFFLLFLTLIFHDFYITCVL